MEWVTTTLMLDRLDAGQDAAWDEFVTYFRDPVRRFALRLGLPEASADDVVQESMVAFLRAFRAGRYDRDRGRLSSWLFGIAYREAARTKRDAARAVPTPGGVGGGRLADDRPDERADDLARRTWDETWERFVFDRCLERLRGELSETAYRAFEMTTLRSVPPTEVARQLGMTRNAVFIAKHRALRRVGQLRAEFEGGA